MAQPPRQVVYRDAVQKQVPSVAVPKGVGPNATTRRKCAQGHRPACRLLHPPPSGGATDAKDPAELNRNLRVLATQEGTTVNTLVVAALDGYLAKRR